MYTYPGQIVRDFVFGGSMKREDFIFCIGYQGDAAVIDGQAKKEYSNLENIKVIATGGLAHLISEDSEEIEIIDENLTLDGLNLICLR